MTLCLVSERTPHPEDNQRVAEMKMNERISDSLGTDEILVAVAAGDVAELHIDGRAAVQRVVDPQIRARSLFHDSFERGAALGLSGDVDIAGIRDRAEKTEAAQPPIQCEHG